METLEEGAGDFAESPESAADVAGTAANGSLVMLAGPSSALGSPSTDNPSRDSAVAYVGSLLSTRSRDTARCALRRIARLLGGESGRDDPDAWLRVPWTSIGPRETTLIQAALVKTGSPNTSKVTMSMLRGVLRQAFRLGHVSADQYHRAISTSPIKGSRLHSGRALSKDEVAELRRAVSRMPPPFSVMLWAIFACGLGAGLRREEIATLRVDSLTPDGRLKVLGKGARERAQSLPSGVVATLRHWLRERSKLGLRCSAMFVQLSRSGRARDAGISGLTVWRLIRAVGGEADVVKFTPHDLRRTFATRMLDRTDLATVQRLMGHQSATTTTLYDHRGAAATDKAVTLLEEWGDDAALEGADDLGEVVREEPAPPSAAPPRDVFWAQRQARGLSEQGYSATQIATALTTCGIVKKGGASLTAADVDRLLYVTRSAGV